MKFFNLELADEVLKWNLFIDFLIMELVHRVPQSGTS